MNRTESNVKTGPAAQEAREHPVWFDGRHVNERRYCEDFLSRHPMRTRQGRFLTADGFLEDENVLGRQILAEIGPYVNSGVSRTVANMIACMRLQAEPAAAQTDLDRIHAANGTLFLDGTFSQSRLICVNRLRVAYNPKAPAPKTWLRFLNDLLYPEDIATLQEYLGYCLIPTTKAQRMMMILGRGGEGKSQIGRVLSSIFGPNMSTSSIQKIETNRFARADLENRLLMVDDDMDMNALPKTNHIKSIVTAQYAMDVERKGIQSYQAQLYVRFLCFGNGALESLYDKSDGFYRRQIILTAKERPKNRRDDPFIAEAMIAEREGIFNWMLAGLHQLLSDNFRFRISARTEANLRSVRSSSNNILDFLCSEGYIRWRADREISSRALYRCYQDWCEDNALKPLSAQRLINELRQNEEKYGAEYSNNIIWAGKRVRGFLGIEAVSGQQL